MVEVGRRLVENLLPVGDSLDQGWIRDGWNQCRADPAWMGVVEELVFGEGPCLTKSDVGWVDVAPHFVTNAGPKSEPASQTNRCSILSVCYSDRF